METKHKTFKPFDKVLVRTAFYPKWSADYYSHYDYKLNCHETIGAGVKKDEDILPYEGNEHLVGTTDEPEEEVKLEEGEWAVFSDILERLQEGKGSIDVFKNIHSSKDGNYFITNSGFSYIYCICSSDFKLYNIEETRKHILCVKNGKVVRYKG